MSDDEWRKALAENPTKARRWIYAAAVYGDIDAQIYWAQMQLDGYGTKRDPEGAFRWFAIAAESKRADAINMVGRCHERGWGAPVDFMKAAACYRMAAEKSFDWAQFNLASLLLEGKGVTRDTGEAFDLFMKAAAQGHAKSMNMIGHFYEHGWDRSRDMEIAAQWYRRAAEGGDFRGQYRYGQLFYERGSLDDALPWFRLAVENAPHAFCVEFANEFLRCPEPALRALGADAQTRCGLSNGDEDALR